VSISSGFHSKVTQTIHPLVALYSLQLPDGATAWVDFGPTTNYGLRTSTVDAPAGGGEVAILVAGMQASSVYHLCAQVELASGTIEPDNDHSFQTGMLPLNLMPQLTVQLPDTPNPGVELINLNPKTPVVSDPYGNILWYYYVASDEDHNGHPMPIKNLPNGNMMALITNRYTGHPKRYCVLREVNLACETVTVNGTLCEIHMDALNEKLKSLTTSKGRTVQVEYFSHDFCPLPNGHVILICQEFVKVDIGGTETLVWGDALVDLDGSFNPVWVWSAFDWLDVNRHPYEWHKHDKHHDWTHCNTISATPDGNLMLSVRNQNWILKLNYNSGSGDGSILWTLGYEGNFTLESGGDANWFYAQHDPTPLTTSENLITSLTVIDNGNDRAGTTASPYSRALIVDIDETALTANVAWQYPANPDFYSYWGGSVVQLPNGNMEVCMTHPTGKPSFTVELTFDTLEVVWEMSIEPAIAYRCYRIPSLYPGVTWNLANSK
jgi:arylsulfate sulfotransferase